MQGDAYTTDDAAIPPDPDVGVRLTAATTLIHDDGEPDTTGPGDGAASPRDGATATSGTAGVAAPTPPPTPPLRVVLAFRPCPREAGAAVGYDVTISADRGKDAACDPYWRSFAGLDLHGALAVAAGVVAAAEEQWLSDPTYPRVTPQPGKTATKPATGGKGKAAPAGQRPPAAPTAILPAVGPSATTAPPDRTPRPESSASATVPEPPVAVMAAAGDDPAGRDESAIPALGGPPLPLGKPSTGAKKAGDRKQLSLFG